MAIPIEIKRIKTENQNSFNEEGRFDQEEEYLIEFEESNAYWKKTYVSRRYELLKLRETINAALGFTAIAETLDCTMDQAERIYDYQNDEEICENCKQKNKICYDCIYTCQSPLEQALFVALENEEIESELQRRINKDGSGYSKDYPVNGKKILTLPDFYIESGDKNIAIYADGHTYHERTEDQALRDRNIDRELQNLGFVVLRFTGKEIREDMSSVIESIKKVM